MNHEALNLQIATVRAQLDAVLRRFSSQSLSADLSAAELSACTEQMQQLATCLSDLQQNLQQSERLTTQHQQLMEQYQRDRRLMVVAQRLRQSLDAAEILEQTVEAVQELLQVDRAVIYQFKAAGEAVEVAVASQATAAAPRGSIEAPQAKALADFCQQVGAIVLDQTVSDQMSDLAAADSLPPALSSFVEQQQATALLAAPIGRGDVLMGIIAAHQRSGERSWHAYEIDLLQQLATEVAIALQHSELYQQAQQQNINLEQQVRQRTEQLQNALDYESMLKRITDRVRDSLDEKHIVQAAVQELTVILKLAGCNAALYDFNQGTSTIHYEYTQSIPTSQGRVAQMENFPEIYQQLQCGWYFQFCSLLPNPARGRVAMLACPIFVDSESSRGVDQSVLGDLWLIYDRDRMFDDHEIRLVQQVANQCAIAIRQARLYQAAQGQVQELAELNRLKDEFLSTVSHELRTPITNVKMAVQMLRTASSEEKRSKYLRILEQEATREADLINDLLDLQQLQVTLQPLDLELIDLSEWLPRLIEPFQPRFTACQHRFQIDAPNDLLPIASEVTALRRILAELLNNACKYTAAGGEIRLSIQPEPNAGITFIICNQAIISAAELSKIFDKFYRCRNADPWKQGGTGLGLALVKKLVERLQGTIQAASVHGWTTFTVKLPSPLEQATRN